MPVIESGPGPHLPGVAGRTADESSPAWPTPKRAAKAAPNVLFVVLDDTGAFPFTGTIHTVTIDVSGELVHDTEAEMRVAMARQ
jgi:hypothetical protein